MVAALRSGYRVLHGDRGLAGAGGPHQQRTGSPLGAATQQLLKGRDTALDASCRERLAVFARHESGKHHQTSMPDREVVESAAIVGASEFYDAQSAPCCAIQGSQLFQGDYAVGDTLQLHIRALSDTVVEQEDSTAAADKELLQRQDLAAIAQRGFGEQAKLRG